MCKDDLLEEILRVERLSKQFVKKYMLSSNISMVKAVEDVSFSLYNGEVLVIAGESGSGKSTIAKLILGAIDSDSGEIFFEGVKSNDEPNFL